MKDITVVSYHSTVRLFIQTALMVCVLALPLAAMPQGNGDDPSKKGDELYKAGNFRGAIEKYKEVLARNANDDHATAYIAYAFNKLGDRAQARQWMHKRVEIAGQSPSVKAQVLTDIALLCWDEAHMSLAAKLVAGQVLKPEDIAAARKLLDEGIESAQRATTIAPASVKAFNILNLLYRSIAESESDAGKQKEALAKAGDALRQAIKFYEAAPDAANGDLFAVPTVLMSNTVEAEAAFTSGEPIKAAPLMSSDPNDKSVSAIEVFVGTDGKIKLQRVIVGDSRKAAPALTAARQWEFQPSSFEGHTVQVAQVMTFGGEAAKASGGKLQPAAEELEGKVIDHIERGNQLAGAGKFDDAIAEFKAASVAAGKPVYTALLGLGSVYMQKSDYRAAAEVYQQASGLRPQDAASQYNLGEALYSAGDYAQAEAAYRKAIDLSPGRVNSRAHHFLGLSMYNQKRLDEAIAEYHVAIDQAKGGYAEARYNLGIALLAQGKLADAEREFRTAIDQEKQDWPEAHFNLASVLERQRHFREAADEYEIYLRQSPDAKDAATLRRHIDQIRSQK